MSHGPARRWFPLHATVALGLVIMVGCAPSKAPFDYTPPYIPRGDSPPRWQKVAISVIDERHDRRIDDVLTTAVDEAVGDALAAELRSAALVGDASHGAYAADTPAEDLRSRGFDAHLVATIRELRCNADDDTGGKLVVYGAGIATLGLVGAVLTSGIRTEIYGYAAIQVRFTDFAVGGSLGKTYTGHCEREWPVGEVFEPGPQAVTASCSFGLAMRDLRADLEKLAATSHTSAAVAR